jgi:hypothetical protein
LFLAADPKAPTLAFVHCGCRPGNDKEDYAFLGGGYCCTGSISH